MATPTHQQSSSSEQFTTPIKFHIRTLGCKMNWLDSARVAANLVAAGYSPADTEAEADLVLINSCTVTGEAERKSRQETRAALQSPAQVAVMGCAPRVDAAAWQALLPGEQIFTSEAALYDRLQISPESSLTPLTSRTRLPVAIQQGCDNHCTFCITRTARGAHRSHTWQEVVTQIQRAEEAGVKEVILTGINLAAWGCQDSRQPAQSRLPQLLERILERTSIPRIRLSSLGPQYLRDNFFDLYADERICDQLHLSIQSGSNEVLNRMERGYTTDALHSIATNARARRTATALTADLIVGFPSESEAEFTASLELVRDLELAKLHLFPFSPRAGTPAAEMANQVAVNTKKRRAKQLRTLGRELRSKFINTNLGRQATILIEHGCSGLTTNAIRLRAPNGSDGELFALTVTQDLLVES